MIVDNRDTNAHFCSFAVDWTACLDFQTRRIVGLYSNPFNAGSDWHVILSKERGVEGSTEGNDNGRAEEMGETTLTLTRKRGFLASGGMGKR